MLDNITKNIGKIFDKISGKKIINEDDLNQAFREIRVALLEADVSLPIAKEFIEKVKVQALGKQVTKSVSAGQMIIKIVNDCLVELLGSEKSELNLEAKPPVVIMMAGLQGAGKTTSAAKIALRLHKKNGKKTLLASLDAYRPAAKEQLEILAKRINVESLEIKNDEKPLETAKRALKQAKEFGFDVLILDTAGRTAINQELMQELIDVKKIANPHEILLAVDAMIGQDAINVAKTFHEKLDLTGIILSRMDGDARGGVALTMRQATNCAIKFVGVGENVEDLEEFDPKRIASRIVGMGDIVSLVEKAQEIVDVKEAEEMAQKMQKGKFDFEDLLKQIRAMKKMGGMSSIVKLLPGASKITAQLDKMGDMQKEVARQEALILSMTPKERKNPDLLSSSRKRRIAAGAGSTIQEVNRLMKKYKQMQKMMKKFGKIDKNALKEMMDENGGIPQF
jgi:signal recognition particle subunit SRP54